MLSDHDRAVEASRPVRKSSRYRQEQQSQFIENQRIPHEYYRISASSRSRADHYAIRTSSSKAEFSKAFKSFRKTLLEKLCIKSVSLSELWHMLHRSTKVEADLKVCWL